MLPNHLWQCNEPPEELNKILTSEQWTKALQPAVDIAIEKSLAEFNAEAELKIPNGLGLCDSAKLKLSSLSGFQKHARACAAPKKNLVCLDPPEPCGWRWLCLPCYIALGVLGVMGNCRPVSRVSPRASATVCNCTSDGSRRHALCSCS